MSALDQPHEPLDTIAKQLFEVASRLEENLPEVKAGSATLSPVLNVEQFDSLLASW